MMKPRGKVFAVLMILFITTSIFLPITAMAAPVSDTDPWYVKPILWILDQILSVFGGIHDPADHVFYHSCFKDEVGCDNKVWGMYTQDSYNHVIRRGFALFSVAITFIITAAIIKSGVLLSTSPLSSTLKVETTETFIKCLLAMVLIGNFFTVSGSFFKANNMIVSMVYQDIKNPVDLSSYGPDLNGNMQSKVPDGQRVVMRDFSANQNGLGKVIVSFATRGLAIWWEVFYLQRFLFISLMIVLAPLWIAVMFYPMLQGITMAAFKELWSQIVAQAVHAGLFWLFFNIFDKDIGWFHVTVAMALFIPLSESVRFIFGSTSQTGSKLAMAGTAAGLGAFMHMGRAVGDLKNGFSTVREHLTKKSEGVEGGGAVSYGGGGQNIASRVASVAGIGGFGGSGGGRVATASGGGDFGNRTRLAGGIAGALGKAGGRIAGASMGTGLGPLAQHVFAEAGASVGDGFGYRAGAIAAAGTEGAINGSKAWANNTKQHYTERMDVVNNREPLQNADPVTKAAVKGVEAVGSAVKGMFGGVGPSDPAVKRSNMQKVYGAIGELVVGKGGYQIGEGFAKSRYAGTPLSPKSFNHDQNLFTVESRDGSFLAREGEDGHYERISNIGKGNTALAKGQVVAKPYVASKENGQPFSIKPIMQPSGTKQGFMDEAPAVTFNSEGQQMVYEGKTVSPSDFLEKGRPSSYVDMRRKQVNIPTLKHPLQASNPSAIKRSLP
ncbi:hypothetical protein [Paenibacillus sp. GP183]|uniref:hypothetical protein n=1 Tax=Paenibacillus sp. GP183 TaxID=1882751 RepID=UPI00089C0BB6|nr:hypothetical protein [Paenibacillus sp. GP183]SED06254.1 hypothetical protein SAMN05443246_5541 [Paenibacillus sp. GP183]